MTTTTEYTPAQPPQQPTAPRNGAALASLILGIASLLVNVLLVPSLLGIIFGIVGLVRSSRLGRKGMAIAGIILSAVGIVVGVAVMVFAVSLIGAATTAAASAAIDSAPRPSAAVTDDADAPDDGASDGAAAAADVPDGYKVVSDDLWFKWGKSSTSYGITTKKATVITPKGCNSLLLEANEYDDSGTNVGSTLASATNLGAGDKAKVEFTFSDKKVDSLRINDVTCF